ncbi:MAG: endonuclease/exonuclease/phosphatase family metal-dependent hydrolase [Bradymonadia bacterium]|jgi:endonuclease/exonuclease/phosphatase family metal-dependent hydrolase
MMLNQFCRAACCALFLASLSGCEILVAGIDAFINTSGEPADSPATESSRAPGASNGESPATTGQASTFSVFSWNINSGVHDEPEAELAEIIRLLETQPGVQIYALSEVHPTWLRPLTDAADRINGTQFDATMSETGNRQRLMLLVDTARFRPLEVQELHRVNPSARGRSPLGALLEDRETGEQLFVVVVHLRRGDDAARMQEAAILNGLVSELQTPALLTGDFNFDCPADVESDEGCNEGYGALTAGQRVQWHRHDTRQATHCSRTRYNSVLDFVFTSDASSSWDVEVQQPRRGDFCSWEMGRGSHAPLRAELRVTGAQE